MKLDLSVSPLLIFALFPPADWIRPHPPPPPPPPPQHPLVSTLLWTFGHDDVSTCASGSMHFHLIIWQKIKSHHHDDDQDAISLQGTKRILFSPWHPDDDHSLGDSPSSSSSSSSSLWELVFKWHTLEQFIRSTNFPIIQNCIRVLGMMSRMKAVFIVSRYFVSFYLAPLLSPPFQMHSLDSRVNKNPLLRSMIWILNNCSSLLLIRIHILKLYLIFIHSSKDDIDWLHVRYDVLKLAEGAHHSHFIIIMMLWHEKREWKKG